jgi:hypothetical protein
MDQNDRFDGPARAVTTADLPTCPGLTERLRT